MTGSGMTRVITEVSAIGLVLALWAIGVVLWWRGRRKRQDVLKQRLDSRPEATVTTRTLRLWHEGKEATMVVREESGKLSISDRLEQLRLDAGFSTALRTLLLELLLASTALGFALVLMTGRALPAVLAVIAVLIIAWTWTNSRATKRAQAFERQLVDALELSARALRAGHPLLASFQLIGEEIPAPVGTIFNEICQQQAMGVRMDDALRRTAQLTRNKDMQLLSASLAIHMRTGGNLADVMQSLAIVIRDRMRLGRRFKTLTAQTTISKRILLGMPFVLFALLNLVGPDYMDPMYSTKIGNILMAGSGVSLLIGWAVMNRLSELTP